MIIIITTAIRTIIQDDVVVLVLIMNFLPLAEPTPDILGEVNVSQQIDVNKCDCDDADNNNINKLM